MGKRKKVFEAYAKRGTINELIDSFEVADKHLSDNEIGLATKLFYNLFKKTIAIDVLKKLFDCYNHKKCSGNEKTQLEKHFYTIVTVISTHVIDRSYRYQIYLRFLFLLRDSEILEIEKRLIKVMQQQFSEKDITKTTTDIFYQKNYFWENVGRLVPVDKTAKTVSGY
jgi:hypothetical protein